MDGDFFSVVPSSAGVAIVEAVSCAAAAAIVSSVSSIAAEEFFVLSLSDLEVAELRRSVSDLLLSTSGDCALGRGVISGASSRLSCSNCVSLKIKTAVS